MTNIKHRRGFLLGALCLGAGRTGLTQTPTVLFQSGTGATAEVGINTTTPASTLDVNGTTTLGGATTLPPTGTATATAGDHSEPLYLVASAYNSAVGSAVPQTFGVASRTGGKWRSDNQRGPSPALWSGRQHARRDRAEDC